MRNRKFRILLYIMEMVLILVGTSQHVWAENPGAGEVTENPEAGEGAGSIWEGIGAYDIVQFRSDISSLVPFPETAETKTSIQSGQKMLHLKLKGEADKGNVGVRYKKVVQKQGVWYDLKITVADFETAQVITKEGEVTVYPDIAFCQNQITWGRTEALGSVTLKVAFTESETDNIMPGTKEILWKLEGVLLPVMSGEGENALWQNQEEAADSKVDESATDGITGQMGDGVRIIKEDPQVKLIITEYNRISKKYTYKTLFQVYEWDGSSYSIYRGSLIYYGKGQQYIMEHLVRNDVNQGRYKVVKADGSWQQEFLVPSLAVVTSLYYHIET